MGTVHQRVELVWVTVLEHSGWTRHNYNCYFQLSTSMFMKIADHGDDNDNDNDDDDGGDDDNDDADNDVENDSYDDFDRNSVTMTMVILVISCQEESHKKSLYPEFGIRDSVPCRIGTFSWGWQIERLRSRARRRCRNISGAKMMKQLRIFKSWGSWGRKIWKSNLCHGRQKTFLWS